MVITWKSFLLICCLAILSVDSRKRRTAQDCNSPESHHKSISGFVGYGWDALQSKHTYPILSLNFSLCQKTGDGKYLVPHGVRAAKIESQYVQKRTSEFDNLNTVLQDRQNSIAPGIDIPVLGPISIGGSFSTSFIDIKQNMTHLKTDLKSFKFIRESYELAVMDGEVPILNAFSENILEIAEAISSNLSLKADYLTQKMVKQYGTHVITKATLGAMLERLDYTKLSEENTNTTDEVDAGVKLKLGVVVPMVDEVGLELGLGRKGLDGTFGKSLNETKTHDEIRIGTFTFKEQVKNELYDFDVQEVAGLRYNVKSLSEIITRSAFPSLDAATIEEIRENLNNAVAAYYNANTISGCMNPKATNFNFQANLEDGSCKFPAKPPLFGGFYRECSYEGGREKINTWQEKALLRVQGLFVKTGKERCNHYQIHHMVTKQFSCPQGFNAILLHSHIFVHKVDSYSQTDDGDDPIIQESRYRLNTYWCQRDASSPSAFDANRILFGGFYRIPGIDPLSDKGNSMMHSEYRCPRHFKSFHFLGDTFICISPNYRNEQILEVELGGIYSCQSSLGDQICPFGYESKFLVAIDDCKIHNCTLINSTNIDLSPPKIKLPPYFQYDLSMPLEKKDNLFYYFITILIFLTICFILVNIFNCAK